MALQALAGASAASASQLPTSAMVIIHHGDTLLARCRSAILINLMQHAVQKALVCQKTCLFPSTPQSQAMVSRMSVDMVGFACLDGGDTVMNAAAIIEPIVRMQAGCGETIE